ncbi:MAG: hypothetical protein V8R75_05095 [Oscillospiraceae bacterium]
MRQMRINFASLRRRLEAGALAAGTLWVVAVTAGSDTAASAASALKEALPMGILRWELGDLWTEDQLSSRNRDDPGGIAAFVRGPSCRCRAAAAGGEQRRLRRRG